MSGRRVRAERTAAAAGARRPTRSQRRRWIVAAGGAVIVLILLVVVLAARKGSPRAGVAFVGNATCSTDGAQPYGLPAVNGDTAVGQPVAEMPHLHVRPPTRVTYAHDPPTSGCHYNIPGQAPIKPGVYDRPVDAEYWVHNLEHGYVVVLYNCPTGCADDVQTLLSWYRKLPPDPVLSSEKKVIVLPWATMAPHFAVVSWDWYQPMDSLDMGLVQRFYDNHVDQSPESNLAG